MNISYIPTKECWKGGNSKRFVILHHTASSRKTTLQQMVNFFLKWDYISIHYIVGPKGDIVSMVNEDDRAWHAGRSHWKGTKSLNNHSIGIEIVSDGYNFTNEQRKATLELTRYIIKRNNISIDNVLRHADIAPGRKWDVGDNFFTRWGDLAGFQSALVGNTANKKIKSLERKYARYSKIANNAIDKLNDCKEQLADAKGVLFIPHKIV